AVLGMMRGDLPALRRPVELQRDTAFRIALQQPRALADEPLFTLPELGDDGSVLGMGRLKRGLEALPDETVATLRLRDPALIVLHRIAAGARRDRLPHLRR